MIEMRLVVGYLCWSQGRRTGAEVEKVAHLILGSVSGKLGR